MPRKYVRKTEQYNYSAEKLKEAINAIRVNGKKIREVGRVFEIPESTLRKYLKKPALEIKQPSLGRKPTIPEAVEREMVEFIILLCNMFYGLTPKELRRLAYNYVEDNGINHNFNKKVRLAGKDWLYNFLKRNPTIKLRQPENTSLNRITAFNEDEVKLFFENLRTVIEKFKIEHNRIYNQDETGITTVQKKCSKVFASKGAKRVGSVTSAERGRTITAVFCMSAGGYYIPPMLIYPRKRMTANLQKNGPGGAVYCCSNNGWSNGELFLEWLSHFKKHTNPTIDDPTLLILDNHISHISIEAYKFCKINHIHMISLPPHTSHRLQPLDLCFFGPLKNALYREYDLYLMQTGHTKITEYDVAELLKNSFVKVATLSNALSGFRSAGIYPFNPDKFSENDFAPASNLQQLRVEEYTEPEDKLLDLSISGITVQETTLMTSTMNQSTTAELFNDPKPSTSVGISNTALFRSYLPALSRKKETVGVKPRKQREKQHSEILTSTPIKIKLEADLEKKHKRENLKKKKLDKKTKKVVKNLKFEKKKDKIIKKTKKKKEYCTSTSDDSELDLSVICNDDEMDDIDTNIFEIDAVEGDPNEICSLCGDHGKDKELWYRCILCSKWYHAACTASESAKDFICDQCMDM